MLDENAQPQDQSETNPQPSVKKKWREVPGRFVFGIVVTLAYFAVILWLRDPFKIETLKVMRLSELGDSLAGFFGPVAFLWLILGYLQQGEELKQNNEALTLQAKELSRAVVESEKSAAAMEAQVNIMKQQWDRSLQLELEARTPDFSMVRTVFHRHDGGEKEIEIEYTLDRAEAFSVRMNLLGYDPERNIDERAHIGLRESITTTVAFGMFEQAPMEYRLLINYQNIFRERFQQTLYARYDHATQNLALAGKDRPKLVN